MNLYKELLEQKIGQEKLAAEFPLIYQLLNKDLQTACKAQILSDELFTNLSDQMYLAYVYYDSQTNKLHGKLIISTTRECVKIALLISILDKDRIIKHQDHKTLPEEGNIDKKCYYAYEFTYDFTTSGKKELSNCFYIKVEAGIFLDLQSFQTNLEIPLIKYKIEEIYKEPATVIAPRKLLATGSNTINVYYKRYPDRFDMDVDYVYDYAIQSDDRVEISLPMVGETTLVSGKQFGSSIDEPGIKKVILDFKKGGIVYSNPTVPVSLSGNQQSVEWMFDEEWNGSLPSSVFNANNTCELTMQLRYCLADTPEPSTMFVTSLAPANPPHCCKKIKSLKLCLGCVAEGTKVRMTDGSEQPIENIRIGDMVMSDTSGSARVENVWRGHEDTLVCITLINGRTLRLSGNHTVLTERGLVRADKLNGADQVMTEDGRAVAINYLYDIPYEGTVYNLDVVKPDGTHSNMICEGMIITDNYGMNNSPTVDTPTLLTAEEQKLAAEVDKLVDYLNTLPIK